MKRLPLIALTLIAFTTSAQRQHWIPIYKPGTDSIVDLLIIQYARKPMEFGIRGGISTSWFNHGDKTYTGTKNLYGSVIVGLYDKIPLSTCVDLQMEINFAQNGAKHPSERNPNGDRRTFKTSYIQLPVTLSRKFGSLNLQGGVYLAKLIGAKNYDLFTEGKNFSWHVGSTWKWYQSWDYGLVAGMGINLHPINLELHYRHGLHDVRKFDLDYNGNYDPSYQKCHNASADVSLYIPLSIFKS